MKKFYVASSFKNVEAVRWVSGQLTSKGYVQTYDWTKYNRAMSIKDLKEIGQEEKKAVMEADCHIELGIALGQGKEIFLYAPNHEVSNFETTSTFYHLSEVKVITGTIDELINIVINSGN